MLEIKNGGMAVNGHRLFGNLSFTIHEGEVLGVSSEDDAATTMLLRAVLGFEPLSEGYLSIDHELMNTRSASFFRHRMSYLPKDVTLPYKTVSELLDELSSLCTPHLTREQFFEFWTELSIAPAVYDQPVAELSPGYLRLLILTGICLMHRPIVVIEEPATDDDSGLSQRIGACIRETARQGSAVIVGCQEHDVLINYCDIHVDLNEFK